MIEWMVEFIQNVGVWLMSVLPTSPFADFIEHLEMPEALGWVAFFFPVHEIIVILGAWLVAIGLFYAYSVIMRWVKLIGD